MQGAIVWKIEPVYTKHVKTNDTFQEVEHTADWALRVRGDTLPGLFVNAAAGMYALIVDAPHIQVQVERPVEVAGVDAETLLVNWLNELLYYTEVDGLVFGQFEIVDLAGGRLRATARGQAGAPLRKHIKAATFHNVHIVKSGGGLSVTIVFDV